MTPALFALLMRDAAKLLRPAAVVPLPSETSAGQFDDHPSLTAVLALSDVSSLFQITKPKARDSSKPPPQHPATAKLTFYAARITHTPTYILSTLATEVVARARLVEREGMQDDEVSPLDGSQSHASSAQDSHTHPNDKRSPKIEELP